MPVQPEIAVTGYAARLPGATSPDEMWQILKDERCTVSEIPEDRWHSAAFLNDQELSPGRTYTRSGGVLSEPFKFDAAYFGISPREAQQMDPQQRLLLEVTAQAFDHAGVDPNRIDRDKVGVFIGASSSDHSTFGLQDPKLIGAHYMLGNTLSIFANRISYQWDLHGPSYVVDTACSSGLFALDQARRAIESGVISTAIVGSVNLLLSPLPFIGFSQAGMLSRQGLCSAFSANADGYVRSEGAVVLILEAVDQARLAGRRIRSRLVTTAVNTVGRSAGLALPSAERQKALITSTLETKTFDPNDLAFVEAHGTGTAVGDPREATALGATYGNRRSNPLPIGSAKSNFGHLEPVSGLVGFLKAQLALEHGLVPKSLHCETLNPDINFSELNLEVLQEAKPLAQRERPWLAGVNSFGFGGANAHAVLAQVPVTEASPAAQTMPPSLVLSAASKDSLQALAEAWQDSAREEPEATAAAVRTANWHLPLHRHRLVIPAETAENLTKNLGQWLSDPATSWPGSFQETSLQNADVAFVFSGNGTLWEGAAKHIYRRDKVFAKAFDAVSDEFSHHGFADLTGILFDAETPQHFGEADTAQPLTFAIQVALVKALSAAGITPKAVLGHSLGEIAAAVCAGKLDMSDGVLIIAERCKAIAELRGKGGMAAVAASRDTVDQLVSELGLPIEISAENTRDSITISGPKDILETFRGAARKRKIAVRLLSIEYPYHSVALDPLESQMRDSLSSLTPKESEIAFYSGHNGKRYADKLDSGYWWHNTRDEVSFRSACMSMANDGFRVFLEITPRTVLTNYLRKNFSELDVETQVLQTLDSTNSSMRSADSIARAVLAAGGEVRRDRILDRWQPIKEVTPVYPFDRTEFRMESPTGIDFFAHREHHPLLGARQRCDVPEFRSSLSVSRLPWLKDHVVAGKIVLPATAIIEMFVSAGKDILDVNSTSLRDVTFIKPIELPEEGEVAIRIVSEESSRSLKLEVGGADNWVPAASARIFSATSPDTFTDLSKGFSQTPQDLYERLADAGLSYGPEFSRLTSLVPIDGGIEAYIEPREDIENFAFDPAVADSALHAIAALLNDKDASSITAMVPARVDRVDFVKPGQITAARILTTKNDRIFDVDMLDEDGGGTSTLGRLTAF